MVSYFRRKAGGLDGGAEEDRTPDLLIANETLYQLSYDPIQLKNHSSEMGWRKSNFLVMGLKGV